MSQRSSQREPQRNGNGRAPAADHLDPWQDDDALHQEMAHLAAENKHLLAQHGEGSAAEVEQLRGENAELRRRVDELENALLERTEGEDDWTERQKEYEALLEEKSEVIRALHQKLQEARESAAQAPARTEEPSSPIDLAAHEDLLMLKRRLEEDRAQFEQDEEALEQQMRQMEMTMSKERAELARQRAELQRLHNELRLEMELAARDNALRERLQPLQRRQQEVSGRKGDSAGSEQPSSKKSTGIFRRIFGAKEE